MRTLVIIAGVAFLTYWFLRGRGVTPGKFSLPMYGGFSKE